MAVKRIRRTSRCALVLAALLMTPLAQTACTRAPTPTGHLFSPQRVVNAVDHWDVLAHELVQRLNRSDRVPEGPIYVRSLDNMMPFAKNFHELLVSRLVDYEMPVTTNPEGAMVLQYRVTPTPHDRSMLSMYTSGRLTGAAAAVYGLHELNLATGGGVYLLGAAAAGEMLGVLEHDSYSEVSVTVELLDGESIVYRDTTIFYVDDNELAHYIASMPTPTALPNYAEALDDMPITMMSVVSE